MFVHNRNYGYGANQKTCYREALRAGADIVVMVHPDYQYDPTLLPDIIRPIQEGNADVVLGFRLLGRASHGARHALVEIWREPVPDANRKCNFRLTPRRIPHRLSRLPRDALEQVNLEMNSDNFIFDQEIIAQLVNLNMRIAEVPVPTRYFPEASSASFVQSSIYGLSILWLLLKYELHVWAGYGSGLLKV